MENIWEQSVARLKEKHPDRAIAVDTFLESSASTHAWVQIQYTPTQLLKRPRFCNVCREKLTGFPQHGWGCDVCKIKTHRRCMGSVANRCKWTTETSIPNHLQYISPENSIMPHQWVEGNISPSSRCAVCERNCGSALRLQDWRCLWCTCVVHDGCLSQLGRGCNLGPIALSTLPPLAVPQVSTDGEILFRNDAIGSECGGGSPLCVLVNSKSGESQGQRLIRKFKRLLNPIQVFDIIATGPDFALSLFKSLDSFRVLVCGGDGTVGWVLSALDRLNLHQKCQLAVLPLGTGNDLARVLGWGSAFYNFHELPSLVQDFERAPTRMLDRWSIMAIEGPSADTIRQNEQTLIRKIKTVMQAEEPREVIEAVKSLCVTVREVMVGVTTTYSQVEEWERQAGQPNNDPLTANCAVLMAKLDNLMKSLDKADAPPDESGFEAEEEESSANEERQRRDSLVGRANSLKKALKNIMTMAERGIDQHSKEHVAAASRRAKFRTKRSKTTPSVLKVSDSNVSSSSACSPPLSPSPNRLVPEKWPDNCTTSGYGASTLTSSNPGLSASPIDRVAGLEPDHGPMSNGGNIIEEDSDEEHDPSPLITRVHPPTPGGTREHSATGEPDRPPVDGERLFKPHSEGQLFAATSGEIKLSHSDSSLYEHTDCSTVARLRPMLYNSRIYKDKREREEEDGDYSKSFLQNSSGNFLGGSLIAEVLMLNARVLGMASPSKCHSPLDNYKEIKVMNNYFGIGLDAKIALDFHNKREGSDKSRSRSKLFLWYGMLGGRELMHRTYRNLEQRIRLECDGVPIELPTLQGLVILNIPSYSGGANVWGTAKDDGFVAQSFDDRLLEVVALFGVIHVATSRVPTMVRLQNHRIAQCRHVRIVILGNEPIPIQVDGEPSMQLPGILQIVHKNRAQLLVRDPAFDATLRKWVEHKERSTAPSTPTALGGSSEELPFSARAAEFVRLVESEIGNLGVSSGFLEALETATASVRTMDQTSILDTTVEDQQTTREDVLAAVERVVDRLEEHFGWPEHKVPANQPRLGPAPHFSFEVHYDCTSLEMKSSGPILVPQQYAELMRNPLTKGDEPDQWRYVLNCIRQEMIREEAALRELRQQESSSGKKRSRFTAWLAKQWRRRTGAPTTPVSTWSVDEVCTWLGSVGLSQYSEQFKANDVRGAELRHLERTDFKDLGVMKIGHVKRLQSAIADLLQKEEQKRRSGRRGISLSAERQPPAAPEPPSLSSL